MVYIKVVVEKGRVWSVGEPLPEQSLGLGRSPVGDAVVLVQARVELKEDGGNLVDCNGDKFNQTRLESSRAWRAGAISVEELPVRRSAHCRQAQAFCGGNQTHLRVKGQDLWLKCITKSPCLV